MSRDETKTKHFCMHALRYAHVARAMESGIKVQNTAKAARTCSIQTTVDRYVHLTNGPIANTVRSSNRKYLIKWCKKWCRNGVKYILKTPETTENKGVMRKDEIRNRKTTA